jgi:Domain of Unknown Function (DUF1080)
MRTIGDRLLLVAMFATCGGILVRFPVSNVTRSAVAAEGNAPASADAATLNTLTDTEIAAGWKLLFDGQTSRGWRTYRKEDVGPGWRVSDGALVCVDPKQAGDLITNDKFIWFELSLEFNVAPGSNSGVMYHVTEESPFAWHTGPEIQILDNHLGAGHESQLAGWLYQLYQPQLDPMTGKPVDATKPAGQWNAMRVVITPDQCATYINRVKYYEYVLGSQDWNDRLSKSKFASMPKFAKSDTGHLTLQGDHGQVSFRNIKIRPLEKAK